VARNRKRAKERRTGRRPQPVAVEPTDAPPGPLAHAAPAAELADEQLAIGAELADEEQPGGGDVDYSTEGVFDDEKTAEGTEVATRGARAPEPRPSTISRLTTFLQGSWHELQRVQWPDRRQVIQATAVVIGFVIIAGVFLGVADTLSAKLMNFILK
jgi:preprotein translocase subunit SecE